MTATSDTSLMAQRLAESGIDMTKKGWLADLCSRVHGDWHFFGIEMLEAFPGQNILVWTNGERRCYVHLDALTREIGKHDGSQSFRVKRAWDRLAQMMDAVDERSRRVA
jgi:hypothetical protein